MTYLEVRELYLSTENTTVKSKQNPFVYVNNFSFIANAACTYQDVIKTNKGVSCQFSEAYF